MNEVQTAYEIIEMAIKAHKAVNYRDGFIFGIRLSREEREKVHSDIISFPSSQSGNLTYKKLEYKKDTRDMYVWQIMALTIHIY